jgi:hypothetical protein
VSHAGLGEWHPFAPAALHALLGAQSARWWIAGGQALELFAGRSWREHADLDAGILRADQPRVFAALEGWELHAAEDAELRLLRPGEVAPSSANSIWCRRGAHEPWGFELLLDAHDGDDWVFRRDAAVRMPLRELVRLGPGGCPYLRPEVQLLYKAKQRRAKDEADFAAVAPLLDPDPRRWLRAALARIHPSHPWLARPELAR